VRCAAQRIAGLAIGTFAQQALHDAGQTMHGGQVQRRQATLVGGVTLPSG
jgi:hypothetical protein